MIRERRFGPDVRIAEQREQLRHLLVLSLPAGSNRFFNCLDLRGPARTRGFWAHAPVDVMNKNAVSQSTLSLQPVHICELIDRFVPEMLTFFFQVPICQLRRGNGPAGGLEHRTEDLIRTSVCDKHSGSTKNTTRLDRVSH